jgi:hypothetical protein
MRLIGLAVLFFTLSKLVAPSAVVAVAPDHVDAVLVPDVPDAHGIGAVPTTSRIPVVGRPNRSTVTAFDSVASR